jgi:hypothetical protein
MDSDSAPDHIVIYNDEYDEMSTVTPFIGLNYRIIRN